MMASSIEAGNSWNNKPPHPWNHRPNRPASAKNSNVNINTNKNDNTNYIISSLLSQLTSNQQNTQCAHGDVWCYEKMLGSVGPAKSLEPAQENDEDVAVSEDEDVEVLAVEKTSDNSKRYRPQTRPSRTSNTNFNSNSNSNSNNDFSSLMASLQQLLNSNGKKIAAKEAPVALTPAAE